MAVGRKTGGRSKGTPNVKTFGVKENLLDVFQEIGGVRNFAKWARENETEFYKHYIKLLPQQINQTTTLNANISFQDMKDEDLSFELNKLRGVNSSIVNH